MCGCYSDAKSASLKNSTVIEGSCEKNHETVLTLPWKDFLSSYGDVFLDSLFIQAWSELELSKLRDKAFVSLIASKIKLLKVTYSFWISFWLLWSNQYQEKCASE